MGVQRLTRSHLGVAAVVVGLLGLSACDRTDERIDRAQVLGEAALEQITGADASNDGGSDMASVSTEARAFAGTIIDQPLVEVASTRPQSRFAIGSIIAKPRDLPPLPSPSEALVMQRPELAIEPESVVVGEPAPAIPETEGPVTTRTLTVEESVMEQQTDSILGDAPQRAILPRVLPREELKIARRAIVTERAVQIQADAESVMYDAMTEFGLGGNVLLDRSGQMVIQLGDDGADPTQFSLPERPDRKLNQLFTARGAIRPELPRMALSANIRCPDQVDTASVRRDQVLATECMLERLRQSGQFEYVEKDFIFEHQFVRRRNEPPVRLPVTPDDPLWQLQWHFFNNGEGESESPGGAGFVDFWTDQNTTGSADVVVAVIDTGLDMDHPDIVGSVNIAPGWDMVSDPRMGNDGDGRDPDADDPGDLCDPTVPFAEDSYHGTHVAGTVGAAVSNNRSGVAGGAWNVTIVPVRALGKCGGRLTDINDAIRWAGGLVPAVGLNGEEVWNDNPADIINLSIGLFEFCPASLQEAINAVVERGAVVVSAAGNARVSTRFYSPGGCQNVISVAAGDARGAMAPYSNYGVEVDVLAPGGDLSRDDNGDGRPDGVLSTRVAQNCFDPVTGDPVDTCYYAFEQGTSMAAPHVSAALALIKSREPGLVGTALSDKLLAALSPRADGQCSGPCSEFAGAEEDPDNPGVCLRPCGGGLLDLTRVDFGD